MNKLSFLLSVTLTLLCSCSNGQDPPDLDSLFDGWIRWSDQVQTEFRCRHVVGRLNSVAMLSEDYGIDTRLLSCYREGRANVVFQLSYKSDRQHEVLTFYCADDDPSGTSLLSNEESAWYFSSRVTQDVEALVDDLDLVLYVPGRRAKKGQAFDDLYSSVDRLDDECLPGREIYRFTLKNPQPEILFFGLYAEMTPKSFVASFGSDIGWLPTELVIEYGPTHAFTFKFQKWEEIDGILLPRRVEGSALVNPEMMALTFETIEKCSASEVRKRCSMEFYDLPEFLGAEKNKSYILHYVVALGFACLLGWLYLRKSFD